MEQVTESPGERVRVIGPAAPESPAEWLDRLDAEGQREVHAFGTMRDAVVSIGKRMGVLRDDVQKDSTTKGVPGSEEPLAAPALAPDDADLEASITSMVDDVIEPPFALDVLAQLYENSGPLRANIDAMSVNVCGFGHRFDPIIDFSHPDVNNQIRDILVQANMDEESIDLEELDEETLAKIDPTTKEVDDKRVFWERVARIERGRLKGFFEFLNPVTPFVELRRRTLESLELLGNAGWEVIREDEERVDSKIVQVYLTPFINVKLLRADDKPTLASMKVRKNEVEYETISFERFFRRYLRVVAGQRVYYKDFGDPRVVSRTTGRYYKSVDALHRAEDVEGGAAAVPASEFLHWTVGSLTSPYGVPRWVGELLSVLGGRAAQEVNFLYFDNKAVPPMVLLVSGGRVSEESVSKLESYIQERLKGRENFHKILVLEAVPAGADTTEGDLEHSGKMRIELKPLTGDMIQDQMFQQYEASSTLKIGRVFRQPPLMTGDQRDANRSTADTLKALAEEQVYQPARDAFDAVMDRFFLPNFGSRFWRFKTNAPIQRIPNDVVENACKVLGAGAITPNEARRIVDEVFDMNLEQRTEEWAQFPPPLALAAANMTGYVNPPAGVPEGDRLPPPKAPKANEPKAPKAARTSKANDHDHEIEVVSDVGGYVRLVVKPAADGHTHATMEAKSEPGRKVELALALDKDEGGHRHTVEVEFPASKRQVMARRMVANLATLRAVVQQELEAAKDDFFNPLLLEGPE